MWGVHTRHYKVEKSGFREKLHSLRPVPMEEWTEQINPVVSSSQGYGKPVWGNLRELTAGFIGSC